MKYPLIRKLGLYVLSKPDGIDYIHAEDLEQVLEKATVVYGNINQVGSTFKKENDIKFFHNRQHDDTHKALLIAIEPLEEKKVTITKKQLADIEHKFLNTHNPSCDLIGYISKELGL